MRSGNFDRCEQASRPTGGLDPPPLGEREFVNFLRKTIDSEVSDEFRQSRSLRDGRPTGGLDPPPLGERECMDFLRKTIDSEVSDEVRQSETADRPEA